jgi:pyruvate dehydrogenase E2 component (dihydrolipoamide acetyltransferase)
MTTEIVRVPDIGSFEAVDVVEVLVAVGDVIAQGDSLITLESDKASLDVPSPLAGEVTEVLLAEGDQVAEGTAIVSLELTLTEPSPDPGPAEAPAPPTPATAPNQAPPPTAPAEAQPATMAPAAPSEAPPASTDGAPPHASPAVRREARQLGVDLRHVVGSGPRGRIVEQDVHAHVATRLSSPARPAPSVATTGPAADFARFGEVELVPLSRIRKRAAANLQQAWTQIPHVTQHDEADVTDLEAFRKAHAEAAKAQGFKLSPLPFVVQVCARALRAFPEFNSSLSDDGESLVLKRYVHVGVAVDTPAGLVVPVIRDADRKGLMELARELAEVSGRARAGKPRLDDFVGGTFTISSLGGIGGTGFTPIVNAPQVAILGVSRMLMKPVWQGAAFEPRKMLPLSLSYDHRVIDGAAAARFTAWIAAALGDLRQLLL